MVVRINSPKRAGEEKMATMKEVESVWEKRHSLQLGKSPNGDRIWIQFFKHLGAMKDPHYEMKEKKSYFSLGFHIEQPGWFVHSIEKKDKLWKFLDEETENFKHKKQIKPKLTHSAAGGDFPIFFDMYFNLNETADNLCDYLEQFIALTYNEIAKYIGKKENPLTLDFGYR